MKRRITRWLAWAMLGLLIAAGLAFGDARPTTIQAADPTPTAAPNSNPGGGSGGGGI